MNAGLRIAHEADGWSDLPEESWENHRRLRRERSGFQVMCHHDIVITLNMAKRRLELKGFGRRIVVIDPEAELVRDLKRDPAAALEFFAR